MEMHLPSTSYKRRSKKRVSPSIYLNAMPTRQVCSSCSSALSKARSLSHKCHFTFSCWLCSTTLRRPRRRWLPSTSRLTLWQTLATLLWLHFRSSVTQITLSPIMLMSFAKASHLLSALRETKTRKRTRMQRKRSMMWLKRGLTLSPQSHTLMSSFSKSWPMKRWEAFSSLKVSKLQERVTPWPCSMNSYYNSWLSAANGSSLSYLSWSCVLR